MYTVGSVWTTLKLTSQTSVDRIKAKCDLHFAFLDRGVIRILLSKPNIPKMLSVGNTLSNPPPLDLSHKPANKLPCTGGSLESDDLLNSSRGEFDFSFDSVAPSYGMLDVFSTTSPSSMVGASAPTTPTIHSPVSDRSFESKVPSPRPYYMPQITNSLGPSFESSDDVTMDHSYAQKIDECSTALPDATAESPTSGKEIPVSSELVSVAINSHPLPDATDKNSPIRG